MLGHKTGAYYLDGMVSASAATPDLIHLLERAGPYGAGNPEPRLAIASARVGKAEIVGSKHVRAILTGEDGRGRLKSIAFGAAEGALGSTLLSVGKTPLHVAGCLRTNVWQGETSAQLILHDVARPAGGI